MVLRLLKSAAVVALCALSAFAVLLFSWLPKGGVYPFISRKVWGPGLLWLAGASLDTEGTEKLDARKHYIFFANHRSYYDIPALCAALPVPVYFVAKREILKIPLFGWGMWAIGMVFVDRSNPERARASMGKAAAGIKKGKSILAFPEGTRSGTGRLQPFKKGIFHVAKQGKIPMVPVAVSGTQQVLPHNAKLAPGHIRVTIGTPITAAEIEAMTVNEIVVKAHRQLTAMTNSTSEPQRIAREKKDKQTV